MTDEDEREFLAAMEGYKCRSGRLFPTCCEILEVLRSLGYAKRIWKPVDHWPATPSGAGVGPIGGRDEAGMFGWYAWVETRGVP